MYKDTTVPILAARRMETVPIRSTIPERTSPLNFKDHFRINIISASRCGPSANAMILRYYRANFYFSEPNKPFERDAVILLSVSCHIIPRAAQEGR